MSRRVADANPNVVLHVRWFRGHHQRAASTKFQPPSSGTIFGLGMGDHDESRKHMVRVNLTVVRNSLPEATGSEKSPMARPRASRARGVRWLVLCQAHTHDAHSRPLVPSFRQLPRDLVNPVSVGVAAGRRRYPMLYPRAAHGGIQVLPHRATQSSNHASTTILPETDIWNDDCSVTLSLRLWLRDAVSVEATRDN